MFNMDAKDIINLRKHLNLTQEDFARLLDVSFVSVNRWESGKRKPNKASLKTLKALANEVPV